MRLRIHFSCLFACLAVSTVLVGMTTESRSVLVAQVSPTPTASAPPVITRSNVDQVQELAMLGKGLIYHLTWLSDGKTLAVVSTTGVWLYDTNAPDLVPRFLSIHTGRAFDKALSPDGTILVTASLNAVDYSVRMWDTATGTQLSTLKGHTSYVLRVVFSPNGKVLASGDESGTVRLWDVGTGKSLAVLQGDSQFISSLVFSADSALLASASWDGSVRIWDVNSGNETLVLRGQGPEIAGVAFSPDGNTLASWAGNADNTLRLWDVHSGTQLWSFEGFDGNYTDRAVFDPRGNLLAVGCEEGAVCLLNTSTGTETAVFKDNDVRSFALAFSPDGEKLAATTQYGSISLWNLENASLLTSLQGYNFGVDSVVFSPDGILLASGDEGGAIHLWDVKTTTEKRVLGWHTSPVVSIAFDPVGTALASASEGVSSLPFQPPDTVRLWDWNSDNASLTVGSRATSAVAFNPDGMLLAYGETGDSESGAYGVGLWDMKKGEVNGLLVGHTDFVTSVAFDPSGTLLASGSGDGTVRVWDVGSRATLAVFRSNVGTDESFAGAVESVVFSPDGSLLASANADGTVRIWDVRRREQVTVLKTDSGNVYGIAFSPNGDLLATPGREFQGEIQLWDVLTWKLLRVLDGLNGTVYSVSFSPDGTLLASAGEDGTIRLWGKP